MKIKRSSFRHYSMTLISLVRNTWSLRSLARCLTDKLGVPISFKYLQRIIKDLGIQCKRPKLELLHGEDYEEGRERVENYKQMASALKKKRVIMAFEDETIITQKPCIRKSLSFEGEHQKIEHNGSRKKFSAYISMVWPEEKLMMYNFYDEMNYE
jgi:hypothetical protein